MDNTQREFPDWILSIINASNVDLAVQSTHSYSLIISLAAGVCLLLWGSITVRNAVERAFSNTLSGMLAAAETSTYRTVLMGMVSAVFLQSATATILLSAGLLNAGAMTMYTMMGIVLGADLGSAIAARILFLDFSLLPSLLIIAGTVLFLGSSLTRIKQIGQIIFGIGMMLLSIQLIKNAIQPVTESSPSEAWMLILQSAPWFAMLIVALITWFAHSSVAIVLVISTFAQTGLINPEIYVPMILGANIGAGLIAIPLVASQNIEARCVVYTNLVARTVLSIALMSTFSWWHSIFAMKLIDPGEKAILLHLAFNTLLVLVCFPIVKSMTNWILKTLKQMQKNAPESLAMSAGFGLDENTIKNPKIALVSARREAFRLGDLTESYLIQALDMFKAKDESQIDAIVSLDDEINSRNRALHNYLSRVRPFISKSLQEEQLDEVLQFSAAMENIGDTISHNLSRLAKKRLRRGVYFSKEGEAEIILAQEEVLKLMRTVVNQFADGNENYQKKIHKSTKKVKQVCAQSMTNQRLRLSGQKSRSISSSSIHQDVLRDLIQIAFLLDYLPGTE